MTNYQSEFEMIRGFYEQLIAKPPQGVDDWPLNKVMGFKDAVCAANISYERVKNNLTRRNALCFLSRANAVIEFYQEDNNHAD